MARRTSKEYAAAIGLEGFPHALLESLVRERLHARERLQLFKVSKAMAATVVEHSPNIKLCLEVDDQEAYNTERAAAKQQAMRALLAPAHQSTHFKVKLEGRVGHHREEVPITWEAIPMKQVTHLTLCQLDLTIKTMSKLQLQRCAQLRTLYLQQFVDVVIPRGIANREEAILHMRAAYFPPSLIELHLGTHVQGEEELGAILGPQITSYLGESTPDASFTKVTHYEHTGKICRNSDLDAMFDIPSLTHVTLQWPALYKGRYPEEIKWQQLMFNAGANFSSLVNLPLMDKQDLIVRNELQTGERYHHQLEGFMIYLGFCSSFKCMPSYCDTLGMPVFRLIGAVSPELISKCAHSLTEPGCLSFHHLPPGGVHSVLPSLPLLTDAINVTSLGFAPGRVKMPEDQQTAQFWQQFVASLPLHIKQVTFELQDCGDVGFHYASTLLPLLVLNQQQQHTVVTILLTDIDIGIPQLLADMIHKYPGRVCVKRRKPMLSVCHDCLSND